MNQRNRWGFTATEKAELWDRWKRAESLKSIGREFGKPSLSVYHRSTKPNPQSDAPKIASTTVTVSARMRMQAARNPLYAP